MIIPVFIDYIVCSKKHHRPSQTLCSNDCISEIYLLSMEYPVLFRVWPLFTLVFYIVSYLYSEWQRIFIAKKSCCFRQISAWLNRYILPLRIQKDICGTFNKFCLSKLNVVSLILVLHYTYMLKKPIFKMSCFFVESPAFSEKMSCFYNKPSGNPSY